MIGWRSRSAKPPQDIGDEVDEDMHLWRRMAVRGEQHRDGWTHRRVFGQDLYELSGFQIRLRHSPRRGRVSNLLRLLGLPMCSMAWSAVTEATPPLARPGLIGVEPDGVRLRVGAFCPAIPPDRLPKRHRRLGSGIVRHGLSSHPGPPTRAWRNRPLRAAPRSSPGDAGHTQKWMLHRRPSHRL